MSEQGEKKSGDALTIRWLDGAGLSARYDAVGVCLQIALQTGERVEDVSVTQSFPVSRPGDYLEFRDGKGESLGILRSLESLDTASRQAVCSALSGRSVIPQVLSVREIRELGVSVILWKTATDRGERAFHTESPRESIRFLTQDRIRITDLAGNQYDIPSIAALDPASRNRLALLI